MKIIIFLYTSVLFGLSAYSQTSDQLYEESLKNYNVNNFNRALNIVQRSIIADSGNGKAYYLRGLIYFQTNRFKQAIPDFDKAIALNAPCDHVHSVRGISKEVISPRI
jgi:tetratricopeptide (TPR) repeat protein